MTQDQQLYFLHAITPLHIGVEDSLGAVDLPTMKERHTHYPLVPGSSVKGVLRAEAIPDPNKASVDTLAAFGPPSTTSGDYRAGLVFTDALLLGFPVRSLCGTFAWVTCPEILRRLNRDLEVIDPKKMLKIPTLPQSQGAVSSAANGEEPSALLVTPAAQNAPNRVFLEELLLDVAVDADTRQLAVTLAGWIWPNDSQALELFRRRLLVIPDDHFGFVSRLAMEVRSRVQIDRATGTAASSGPWTEEHMPAESLLYGIAMGRPTTYRDYGTARPAPGTPPTTEIRKDAPENLKVLQSLTKDRRLLRFGGNGTIGLGRAFFFMAPSTHSSGQTTTTTQGAD